jgi:hypothetical protein
VKKVAAGSILKRGGGSSGKAFLMSHKEGGENEAATHGRCALSHRAGAQPAHMAQR